MQIHEIKIEKLIEIAVIKLDEQYPEETFFEDELYLAMHGLFNTLRWANIQQGAKLAETGSFTEDLSVLETIDHFASEWVSRREIIDCIMHTSGFDENVSELVLKAIEGTVDHYLPYSPVAIDFIGIIERLNSKGYKINLVSTLQVIPDKMKSIRASANKAT